MPCSLSATQDAACDSGIGKVVNSTKLLQLIAQLTCEAVEAGGGSGGGGGVNSYALFQHQEPNATDGGDFLTGAWRTVPINTEIYDAGNFASIAGNNITLDAGTYRVQAFMWGMFVNAFTSRLFNVTNSSIALEGTAEVAFFGPGNASSNTHSQIRGVITIAAPTVYRMEGQCSSSQNGFGFGQATAFNSVEIYSEIEFFKLA